MSTQKPANAERAEWARAAAMAFAEQTGQALNGELDNADMQEVIGDLLCNLHHLADAEGLDFQLLTDRARNHYSEETMLE